jgi:lysophospholipase L1-like esterase
MSEDSSRYSRRTVLKAGGVAGLSVLAGSTFGLSRGEGADQSHGSQQARSSSDVSSSSEHLVGTWANAPQAPLQNTQNLSTKGFSEQTIRSILQTSIGGEGVRVRLTNTFGTNPVTFDHVTIGVRENGAAVAETPRDVTFSGERSVTLASNTRVYSDPVSLSVEPSQELVVSIYAPTATGPATWHSVAKHRTYLASGDHAGDARADAFNQAATAWYFLDGVDVLAPKARGSVVALGDSITDGYRSTLGTDHTWPDFLARRINNRRSIKKSVLNAGISGNRVLYNSPRFGVNAQARLNRDVLAQTGVTDVILLEGINDIGFSQPDITAEQLIDGYQQIIARTHAKGLRIFGGTLTPYKGAAYYTKEGERTRQTVNHWLRTSGAFDGVIDFDQALQDPNNPKQLLPKYDSGDHLHPNDAGYRAMGNAVDLSLLKGKSHQSASQKNLAPTEQPSTRATDGGRT